MSFTQIPSLISFSPLTTILSADVNANNAAIRNAFNGLVTGTNTISVDTITENTLSAGVTVTKPFTVSAGVATFASGIKISGGVVSGIMTFSSGWAISGGVVSGAVTFSSAVAFSTGATITTGAAIYAGVATGAAVATTPPYAFTAGTKQTGMYLDTTLSTETLLFSVTGTNMAYMSASQNKIGVYGKLKQDFSFGVVCAGATLVTSATAGFLYIPTMSATASGTPATEAGTVALAYETGGNHLMIYNGSWKQVALT